MTTGLRERDAVTESWLAADALRSAQVRTGAAGDPVQLGEAPVPRPAKVYPKRSELRRAEARAAARRDGRGGRGRGSSRPARVDNPTRPTRPAIRPITTVGPITRLRPDQVGAGQLPVALRPGPAVLPLPTSGETRPAGLHLPARRGPDAFTPATAPTVPVAVPLAPIAPVPPTSPLESDGVTRSSPVGSDGVALPLPAPWPLAAPEYDLTAPGDDRPAGAPQRRRRETVRPRPSRSSGRVGAARVLVLALVVGAEGVALTTMPGPPRVGPGTTGAGDALIVSAAPSGAVLDGNADRRLQIAARREQAASMVAAQAASGDAKVQAALAQAQAAADRVAAAAARRAARRAQVLRDAQSDPRSVAKLLMAERGWGDSQFSCLNLLWNRESRWNYQATNPSSGAYGIPQALPGSKMGSVAPDWRTNPVTQIKWGLNYIADRYGTPCGAWAHSESVGWY